MVPRTLVINTLPEVGKVAPDFEAFDENGKKISLKQFKGKTVILYFYLKDNIPECTSEACSLRDRFSTFKKKDVVIIGVSKSSQESHRAFIEKYDLPFTLISDTDKKVQIAYGVWQEKLLYGRKFTDTLRATFLIDSNQNIVYIFDKVNSKNYAEEILEKIEELNLG